MSSTREAILDSALACFELHGYGASTTAMICRMSGASNGSLFHHFGSKDGVAAALYLQALQSYHHALVAGLDQHRSAEQGITCLVISHMDWVVDYRPQARFIFEQSRAEWLSSVRDEQRLENAAFEQAIEDWRQPLIAAGTLPDMPPLVFFSLVIGPAQLLSRHWLSSPGDDDLRRDTQLLCTGAVRALVY